jgi:uncharacterized protein (TIGR00297 family)
LQVKGRFRKEKHIERGNPDKTETRFIALSNLGALAAIVVGTACIVAGWSWAALLVAFFVSSTMLSRYREAAKRDRVSNVVEKGGNRDAWQVIANGGVFASLAVVSLFSDSALVQAAAAGALATSTADTWATEVGTLSHSMPRSLLSRKAVEPGTSGGVTAIGTIASLAGALFIALLAFFVNWPLVSVCAALVGGFSGSLIDSILGGSLQSRRWCDTCQRGTERAIHTCGTKSIHAGGIRWLNNDLVNLVSSVGGAAVGLLCVL